MHQAVYSVFHVSNTILASKQLFIVQQPAFSFYPLQNPHWMPEIVDITKPNIYDVFSIHTYL